MKWIWSSLPAKKVKHLGFLFESFLEARWATVFNELGLFFSYEAYHFSFFHTTIPDFFIPKWNIWFEAKNPLVWEGDDECKEVLLKAVDVVIETEKSFWVSFGGFGSIPWSPYEFFMVIAHPGTALSKYNKSNGGGFLILQGIFVPGSPVDMFWGWELDNISQVTNKVWNTDRRLLIPLTDLPGFDFIWEKNILDGSKKLYLGDGDHSFVNENVSPLKISKSGVKRYWDAYNRAKLTKFHSYIETQAKTQEEYQCRTNVWL